MKKKQKKNNGFSKAPHFWQLLSYFVFLANLFFYSFIILPFLSVKYKVNLLFS